MTMFDDRSRLLGPCLALGLAIHGCTSPANNNKLEQPVPALHHAPVVSATTPSGGVRLLEGMGKVDFPITTKHCASEALDVSAAKQPLQAPSY